MGGIREFNCACLIISRFLALLRNTSIQFYTAVYYFLVFYNGIVNPQNRIFFLSNTITPLLNTTLYRVHRPFSYILYHFLLPFFLDDCTIHFTSDSCSFSTFLPIIFGIQVTRFYSLPLIFFIYTPFLHLFLLSLQCKLQLEYTF
jgi:hypothetical protein